MAGCARNVAQLGGGGIELHTLVATYHVRTIHGGTIKSPNRDHGMSILLVLIPLSLALVVLAGWGFFWAVSTGQFDDLESPGWDALRDDDERR
jgi:cbb3-type cytochrome oxidase maturation protein